MGNIWCGVHRRLSFGMGVLASDNKSIRGQLAAASSIHSIHSGGANSRASVPLMPKIRPGQNAVRLMNVAYEAVAGADKRTASCGAPMGSPHLVGA